MATTPNENIWTIYDQYWSMLPTGNDIYTCLACPWRNEAMFSAPATSAALAGAAVMESDLHFELWALFPWNQQGKASPNIMVKPFHSLRIHMRQSSDIFRHLQTSTYDSCHHRHPWSNHWIFEDLFFTLPSTGPCVIKRSWKTQTSPANLDPSCANAHSPSASYQQPKNTGVIGAMTIIVVHTLCQTPKSKVFRLKNCKTTSFIWLGLVC